jgi:hypothetical protein
MNTGSRTVYTKHGPFAETKKRKVNSTGTRTGISSFGPNLLWYWNAKFFLKQYWNGFLFFK